MVARMDAVELEPLIHRKRTEDGMIEHFRDAELLACAHRGKIQPLQIASHRGDHGAQVELTSGDHVLRRLASLREVAEIDHRKNLEPLFECWCCGERLALLEAALKTLGRTEIRALQMFNNLADGPLVGSAARGALCPTPTGGVLDDLATGRQMRMHATD